MKEKEECKSKNNRKKSENEVVKVVMSDASQPQQPLPKPDDELVNLARAFARDFEENGITGA